MTARWTALGLLCTLALHACGSAGVGADPPAPPATGGVSVGVAPGTTTLSTAGQVRFTAAVQGAVDTRVTWGVREGSPAGGAVAADGTYTAPASAGTFHVVATSMADPGKSGSATVLVVTSPPVAAGAPVLYTGDRTHSPIDASLVQRLQDIAAHGSGLDLRNFVKVGDSITATNYFLGCFDGGGDGIPNLSGNPNMTIQLGGRAELASTVTHFRTNLLAGSTLYSRSSIAAQSGADASFPLTASRLDQEIAAVHPQFAVVMYGTNDVGRPVGAGDLAVNIVPYETSMRGIADALLARGVIPIFTTMPPRQDSASYPLLVPAFNGVVRAIAQGRQIPLVDLNRELMALPSPHGMSADGMHPSVANWNTGCWFRTGDLQDGYNVRNLLTIQALHRVKTIIVDGAGPPDAGAPHLAGEGTAASPLLIASLPFGDMRDSRRSTQASFSSYGCAGSRAAPGAEVVYQLVLPRRTALRAVVLDAGANAVGVNLLSAASPASCLKSAARIVAATLDPGTYYLTVDGLAAGGGAEYTLSVTVCAAGDAACN